MVKIDLVKIGFEVWMGFVWFRIGPVVGSCQHNNESLGSIKGRGFFD
jgi:hypothetical protein